MSLLPAFKVAKSCCSLLGGAVQPTHTLHHSSITTGAPFLVHTSCRFSQQAHHCEGVAERVQVHSAVCTAAPKACAERWAVQTAALLVAVQPEIWIPA